LEGMPVLARTLSIFNPLPEVEEIVIAIEAEDILHCRLEVVDRYRFHKVRSIVPGGANRALSVAAALGDLGDEIDTVAVHDGARPLFPAQLLAEGLRELERGGHDGIVFGVPVIDTIKECDPGSRLVTSTPERDRLWAAQTPQVFHREVLERGYALPAEKLKLATDDSSLVEQAGGRVKIVPGARENIKLTEPVDLMLAADILRRRGTEAGEGRRNRGEGGGI
ncbi:MAG: IspD/TarI family cytidylyltransferase, partial [Pseudomonadota bacterium]